MRINIETVTPDMATFLLQANDKNRNITKRVVDRYARQMSNGEWKLNGEAIKVGADGMLLDGQHRLAAIVKSGCHIDMVVVRDVQADAIKTMDTGRPRTVKDHLVIHGFTGSVTVVSAAIIVIKSFESGKYNPFFDKLTPSEAIQFLDHHKGLFHSADRIGNKAVKLLPRSVAVAMHYLFSRVDETKADVFFAQLFSGANLAVNSPVLALRNRLTLAMGENKHGYSFRRQFISYTVRAFDAFINGQDLPAMRYHADSDIVLPRAGA